MFEPSDGPRIFALEPGVDFPAAVARGLKERMSGKPPEAMARVEVLVNTTRMRNHLRAALIAHGPGFLPRLRLITDLAGDDAQEKPPSPLRRRLELAQLVRKLIDSAPGLAPRDAAFALADSLATLLDEMQGERIAPEVLDRLDVSNHSEHWGRSLRFIRLVHQFLDVDSAPDTQARQRRAVEGLVARWRTDPPRHPVLVAGSTGSRGTTALLMSAVATLPQGALILPGFDFDMPEEVWEGLADPLTSEDHPQFRFHALMKMLGVGSTDVRRWSGDRAPNPARNRLISLALRPAPVTDRWLAEGPALGDLIRATDNLTLIESPNPRAEALAIALRLRASLEEGRKAALITPDRTLARQITAALDRWRVRPDDSAGRPLALSAPGRFLRQCAGLLCGDCQPQNLIALLKNPIAHSAAGRGFHLLHLRELELWLRRNAVPNLTPGHLYRWAATHERRSDWAQWLSAFLEAGQMSGSQPLAVWVERHRQLAETVSSGSTGGGTGELWLTEAGEAARAVMDELSAEAEHGGEISNRDYMALSETVLQGKEVRESASSHPSVMIWGTLEARVQGADLVILAGLNEGVWPATPTPDPWFNRRMRLDAGLLLPERQIGLSAHDFQQAAGAPEVVLSRCLRDAEAETIPSRWLNRLKNLVGGLPDQSGPEALKRMIARGRDWIDQAGALENDLTGVPEVVSRRNPRPAPAPPQGARPRELPVTAIKTLIRDPYHVYARYILGLRRLDPLTPEPDARLRGTALHKVIETYVRGLGHGAEADRDAFMQVASLVLADEVPWQASRLMWQARLGRVAGDLVSWQADEPGTPILIERQGALQLRDPGLRLTGRPDRIDRQPDGRLRIFDYKTGKPPSAREQEAFDKQLILLSIMATDGAFDGIDPAEVESAAFVGVGARFQIVDADVSREALEGHRAKLTELLAAYMRSEQGYTARRALKKDTDKAEYDHLSRFGEWQVSDEAQVLIVGDAHE